MKITREDVLSLAQQAGISDWEIGDDNNRSASQERRLQKLERFAHLAIDAAQPATVPENIYNAALRLRQYGVMVSWLEAKLVIDWVMSAAQKPEKREVTRQYYYRVGSCAAESGEDPKCGCWHDEGTGPLSHNKDWIRTWRDKPKPEQPAGLTGEAFEIDWNDFRHPPHILAKLQGSPELTDEEILSMERNTHFHESPDWAIRFARRAIAADREKRALK